MFENISKLLREGKKLTIPECVPFEPAEPVGESETELGTLPAHLRKLYVLAARYEDRAYVLAQQMREMPGARELLLKEKNAAENTADFLTRMYWWEIENVFAIGQAKHGIGLRKGWVLVAYEVPPR